MPREVPARRDWQPFALRAMYGNDLEVEDPWPELCEAVEELETLSSALREEAVEAAVPVRPDAAELLSRLPPKPGDGPPDRLGVQARLRVVLMGRTMAGKSSVLAALSGAHSDRIGDGRQRFSRDTFGAVAAACEDIELVDTPGVGAHEGTDDTEIALKEALTADVVVWVNSSDSIQEESAAALKFLAVIGKPIIVVVNCRQSLEGVGRLNLLKFPERVFGAREGLVEEIRRHLAQAGVVPLAVVHVHALAAAQALDAGGDDELLAASRMHSLSEALLREHTAHSQVRRALRVVDSGRQPAQQQALGLSFGSAQFAAQAARERAMTKDVHKRLNRLVRSAGEAMSADIQAAVGRRRSWHLTVTDFGEAVQTAWQSEVEGLQEELKQSLTRRLTNLAGEVTEALRDAEAEWTDVPADSFVLRDLSGFDAVWGNRLLKAGIGAAGSLAGFAGGAALGGKIGLALGISSGPGAIVTAVTGIVIGGVAGWAAQHLKSFADWVFLGSDGVLRKRRDQVAKQVGPILDQVVEEYDKVVAAKLDHVRNGLVDERARADEHAESIEGLAAAWARCRNELGAGILDVDRATAKALLRLGGRERLARSVLRATRVPGVCVLAELTDEGHSEAWLFPPDMGETLGTGRTRSPGHEASRSLSYAMGLVDAPIHLTRADGEGAELSIDADIPVAVAETWAQALTAHVEKQVVIRTSRRASEA